VPAVLMARGLCGAVMRQPTVHSALTRLIDEVIGARPLRQAASAPSVARQLGLALPAAPG